MSTLGTTQVFGPELDLRPVCKMIIKNELVGSEANSNFANGDTDANPQAFYLTEIPSISLGADIETNNGAKLNEKLATLSETNILGLSIVEMVQNNATNGGGYVPALVMGPSSLKIAKSAHKLNLNLKTRIMFDETINSCEHQPYNTLLRTLMKLIMPANASAVNYNYLKTAFKNFVNGIGGTAGAAAESVKDIDFTAIRDTVKGVAGTWVTAGKALIANEKEMPGIKQDLKAQIEALNSGGNLKTVENNLNNMFDNLIKSYIYREYVELAFSRKGQPFNLFQGIVSATENENFKFIVKNFTVTQSNQLYGNTLYPIYMDFDISLESLGVIISQLPNSLASG